MKSWLRYLLLTFWLGLTVQFNTVAAELYRYKNEDGVTVLDSHVPARYVKNGYTILSLDGRVLEVVVRALSDKEIRDRDRSWRKKKESPAKSASVKLQTKTSCDFTPRQVM